MRKHKGSLNEREASNKNISNWYKDNLFIEPSEENIVKRLSSRWSCPKCKAIFNSVTNLPKEEGKCDLDGEALFQRDDDKPEAVKQRLVQYNKKTAPLIEYYKEKGLLKSYDGNCTPQESIERGMKLVEELMS